MQVLLKTTGTKADNEIPVPPPQESKSLNYDELYATPYQLPNSYTRFSQTVEDCISCSYDMTVEDDEFLKSFNAKRSAAQQLSEDDFEYVMECFEQTADDMTPYATVDKSIVPYSDMLAGLNKLENSKGVPHAKDLYEYWKQRRQACNGPLHPTVKLELHQESDEMDPYVCFRRREVRQTRKTRARDVQSADKLKRLRRELEDGRSLILESYQRELDKQELLRLDKSVHETRASLKELKVRLGIKTNDSDLLTMKVSREYRDSRDVSTADAIVQEEQPVKISKPSHRTTESSSAQRGTAAGALRLAPPRTNTHSIDMELELLQDKRAQQDEELRRDILNKIQNHHHWNRNYVDLTKEPLPPVRSPSRQPPFRAVQAQYLITPPASSASQESLEEPTPMDLDATMPFAAFQFKGAPSDENEPPRFTYRRRIGRLNRTWIDRRSQVPKTPPRDGQVSDRWKYDQDDSEDDFLGRPVYEVDPYDTRCIRFRATIPLGFREGRGPQRPPPALIQAHLEAQQAAAQGGAGGQLQQQVAARPAPSAPRQEG